MRRLRRRLARGPAASRTASPVWDTILNNEGLDAGSQSTGAQPDQWQMGNAQWPLGTRRGTIQKARAKPGTGELRTPAQSKRLKPTKWLLRRRGIFPTVHQGPGLPPADASSRDDFVANASQRLSPAPPSPLPVRKLRNFLRPHHTLLKRTQGTSPDSRHLRPSRFRLLSASARLEAARHHSRRQEPIA